MMMSQQDSLYKVLIVCVCVNIENVMLLDESIIYNLNGK